jgi:hypothetical protein
MEHEIGKYGVRCFICPQTQFSAWKDAISKRHHVFFGYSSGAKDTANRIIRYLQSIDVKVRDWQTNFRPDCTEKNQPEKLDEISESQSGIREV